MGVCPRRGLGPVDGKWARWEPRIPGPFKRYVVGMNYGIIPACSLTSASTSHTYDFITTYRPFITTYRPLGYTKGGHLQHGGPFSWCFQPLLEAFLSTATGTNTCWLNTGCRTKPFSISADSTFCSSVTHRIVNCRCSCIHKSFTIADSTFCSSVTHRIVNCRCTCIHKSFTKYSLLNYWFLYILRAKGTA
jgi:hypothetical protein